MDSNEDVSLNKPKAFREAMLSALATTNSIMDEAESALQKGDIDIAEEHFTQAWDRTAFIMLMVVRRRLRVERQEGGVRKPLRLLLKRIFAFGIKKKVVA